MNLTLDLERLAVLVPALASLAFMLWVLWNLTLQIREQRRAGRPQPALDSSARSGSRPPSRQV